MSLLREAISFFAQIIINSIFVNPSAPHRRASFLSKIIFIISSLFSFYYNPFLGSLSLVEISIIFAAATGSLIEPVSMMVLSSIPAIWMATTGLFFLVIYKQVSLFAFIFIFYKTFMYSFLIMALTSVITPSDISMILYKFTKKVTFPYLFWSLIPFQLKDTVISLMIQKMKKSSLSNSIFIVFSEQLEKAEQITIANSSRIDASIKRFIKKEINKKFTLLFFAFSVINIALLLIKSQ